MGRISEGFWGTATRKGDFPRTLLGGAFFARSFLAVGHPPVDPGAVAHSLPILRCPTPGCEGKGLSVVCLLTGLQSGFGGLLLKLRSAREGALHSCGRAARLVEGCFIKCRSQARAHVTQA